jgi:hypothetical protein
MCPETGALASREGKPCAHTAFNPPAIWGPPAKESQFLA